MNEEELETFCNDIISYVEHYQQVTMKELIKNFPDYDPQEINTALVELRKLNLINQQIRDGSTAFSVNKTAITQKVTIEQINTQIEELKTKLNGTEIADYDLKISALKKIGEIMAEDIQQLLHEICDDLQAAKA